MGGPEEDKEAEACCLYEEEKLSRVKVARAAKKIKKRPLFDEITFLDDHIAGRTVSNYLIVVT